MKKNLLLIATAFVITLNGCKKDEVTSVTLPSEDIAAGTATIRGILKANTDATNATDETVAGEKVVVTIKTQDWYLSPVPGKTYPEKRYEATTGPDGSFEIKVDVSSNRKLNGVTISPIEFTKNKIESLTSTKLYKWVGNPPVVTIGDLAVGEVKYQILQMNGTLYN